MTFTLSIMAWLGVAGFTPADTIRVADARADVERRQREIKAQHDRMATEHKRKFEQMQRQIKADQERLGRKLPPGASPSGANAAATPSSASPPPSFNAANAPSPEDCLWAFVRATRNATSMEQVLPYLQLREQRVLKELQARYDPKQAAKNKQWHRQQNPKMSEEALDHITGPPYVWELKFHKAIAKDILTILYVKIEGNKATLRVSTHSDAVVNGEKYPYSTATVELVGEGNYWKLSRYEDGIMVYKSPPEPRKP